jgi:hypothetical protein
MTPIIHHGVRFRATPKALFGMYIDSRKHSASTSAPATISRKVGGAFTAFSGMIHGKNLAIIPEQRIAFGRKGNGPY